MHTARTRYREHSLWAVPAAWKRGGRMENKCVKRLGSRRWFNLESWKVGKEIQRFCVVVEPRGAQDIIWSWSQFGHVSCCWLWSLWLLLCRWVVSAMTANESASCRRVARNVGGPPCRRVAHTGGHRPHGIGGGVLVVVVVVVVVVVSVARWVVTCQQRSVLRGRQCPSWLACLPVCRNKGAVLRSKRRP